MSRYIAASTPHGLRAKLLWSLLLISVDVAAAINIDEISQRIEAGKLLLEARVSFEFSDDTYAALESGVALIFEYRVFAKKRRKLWWDKTVARVSRRVKIEHHALTNRYIVTDLNDDQRRTHVSFADAQDDLEQIRNIDLGESTAFMPLQAHRAGLRVALDIESLPAPMRPVAYVSPSWRLASDWYRWNLADAD